MFLFCRLPAVFSKALPFARGSGAPASAAALSPPPRPLRPASGVSARLGGAAGAGGREAAAGTPREARSAHSPGGKGHPFPPRLTALTGAVFVEGAIIPEPKSSVRSNARAVAGQRFTLLREETGTLTRHSRPREGAGRFSPGRRRGGTGPLNSRWLHRFYK